MITAIILTLNEESNIESCLEKLKWADEMLVVDSGSSDRTVELAKRSGARVVSHPFTDYASQRNFAMQEAKGDWVLFIDADEHVSPELAEEIQGVIRTPCDHIYTIPFHTFFFGRRLRFGDALRDLHVRLFPRTKAVWGQPVHEKVVTELPCRELKNPVVHYTTRDLEHYMRKIDGYLAREVSAMKERGLRPSWIRLILNPIARFFQLYFWKLGILDGVGGFQYAILSAYYTFEKHRRYLKRFDQHECT
ncbi:MAG: Glucosyl-3-phosphoglycerate synthase [Candidatus Omnitrophica bacterium ADurb.Bin277]|nr:MAG: Glucosyl-3-phosphoglycerate synthase [Candidatus Omnitrophica bacterium ADurb.Bin277]